MKNEITFKVLLLAKNGLVAGIKERMEKSGIPSTASWKEYATNDEKIYYEQTVEQIVKCCEEMLADNEEG